MGIRLALLAFTLLLIAQGDVPDAWADELVQVASHRAATQPDTSGDLSPLLGFLARPNGRGRFPAVILLHGCIGFAKHETIAATTLKTWGYVALALDSLGGVNRCGGDASLGAAAAMRDAEVAFRYLAAQRFVASDRIALMGWSMGATAALLSVEKNKDAGQPGWRGVVAYYPDCAASSGGLRAPALVLVGERDDWAPAASCRKLAAHESDIGVTRNAAEGTPIDLVVYPDATHAFDYKFSQPRYMGHVVQHNEAVSRNAETRVHVFLRDLLGDQPDKP